MTRCSITGTAKTVWTRRRSTTSRNASGSNLRCSTTVDPCSAASSSAGVAPRVEQRRGDQHRVAGLQRDRGQDRRGGRQAVGCGRLAPFGVPVVPDVSTISLLRSGRSGSSPGPPAAIIPSSVSGSVALGAHDARPVRDHVGELRVGDDGVQLLLLLHAAHLVGGQAGVQQHDVGAALPGRDHHLDRGAVVAAQDADRRTRPGPGPGEREGERVGALVELGVGDDAVVVDDGQPVRVPRGADGEPGGDAVAVAVHRAPDRRTGAPGRIGRTTPERVSARTARAVPLPRSRRGTGGGDGIRTSRTGPWPQSVSRADACTSAQQRRCCARRHCAVAKCFVPLRAT